MDELKKKVFEAPQETVSELLEMGLDETEVMTPEAVPESSRVGAYSLVSRLGRGGMGEVWRAKDPDSKVTVALKLLRPELAFDAASIHRFATEARHMAGLSHPNIVKVLRVGEHDGRPFYASPLYRESLAALLARRGALPESDVARIARDLADALAYAHGRGIIHRDLKPANILLDDSGHPCLCDFGLVRTVFNDSLVDVQTRTLEGTIAYMSPATALGQAEDTRCDIYGWGAIVYEMLTGKPPYQAPTTEALLAAVRSGPPRPIAEVNPQASRSLARVAEWAMARELRDRYAEMKDVLRDLDGIRAGQSPRGPHSTNRRTPLVGLAAGLLVAVTAGVGLWHRGQERNVAPAVQDRPADRVVTGEQQPPEDAEMKKMTAALVATALVMHAAANQPANAQKAPTSGRGSLVTLVAPYPSPEPGSPPSERISLQYAVSELARQEGLGYLFEASRKQVGEVAGLWIKPDIRQVRFSAAMDALLLPLGLGYEVLDGKVLITPKLVTLVPPYSSDSPDRISLQYAVLHMAEQAGLGYDFAGSQKRAGDRARRWITPSLRNVPFTQAMKELLTPLGLTYEVRDGKVLLVLEKGGGR